MTVVNSNAPPLKNETRDAVPAISGFCADEKQRAHCDLTTASLQAIAERMDRFQRLEHLFSAAGWNLYPLHDESVLAVHRKWQVSQVCHTLGQAWALLRRISGAA